MVSIKKMSPEVLIYVQSMKQFIKSNEEAQRYFGIIDNEETFFTYISDISQKNFEENGEPELTLSQFEKIREAIFKESVAGKKLIGSFISLGNLGYVSLN